MDIEKGALVFMFCFMLLISGIAIYRHLDQQEQILVSIAQLQQGASAVKQDMIVLNDRQQQIIKVLNSVPSKPVPTE